ncbi:MAG: response regulator [Desulfobacterales bacterium]|jgi:FixJ family two-component response regulator
MRSESDFEVFIVDDDLSVQRALKRLVRSHGLRARIFSSAVEFLSADISPDVAGCVLLDVEMPEMSGIELQAEFRRRGGNLAIVFITGHGNIPMSVQAVKDGALDFIEKPFDPAALVKVVHNAIACSRRLVDENDEFRQVQKNYESLTHREQEVFRLVVCGMLNKEVASKLGIAEKTVKVHRSRVMAKMKADSLADLVRLADKLKFPSPIN